MSIQLFHFAGFVSPGADVIVLLCRQSIRFYYSVKIELSNFLSLNQYKGVKHTLDIIQMRQ